MYKHSALSVIVAFILFGCGNKEEMENRNRDLTLQLASRDQMIEEVTATVNEIHNALENAWAVEKNVVREAGASETGTPASQAELKQKILDRISDMRETLSENRKKITDLEKRLRKNNVQYASLQKMIADLKQSLEEREQSIAQLNAKLEHLESDVAQKAEIISAHEVTIAENERMITDQTKQLNTMYYITGKKGELKEKGIITSEGGILWGLAGTTTVLAADADDQQFQPVDKSSIRMIQVEGKIEELILKRDETSYAQEVTENGNSVLIIVRPEKFWREKRLVVVTD
jgi:uncharacterized protein (DUF3084 family)